VTCKNIYQDPVMQRVMANSGQQSSMSHSYGTTVIMHSVSLIGICHVTHTHACDLGAFKQQTCLSHSFGSTVIVYSASYIGMSHRKKRITWHTCMQLMTCSRVACPTPSALYDNDAFYVIDTNKIGMSHSFIELIHVTHTHPNLASHTAIESWQL